ncbi:hydantoinase/carbamoylase family amidase [Rhizobium sp. NRK18]|uniref:hydantoinase/carbamoylase family amidase n=1 Tax=Rhizobium sp. NRK18 TaxID=2964667 RepID=UPI0021C2755B|nr:hydantoinase/carbamoylase family amidase [Rhizobium sp. NRK18]MCQ2006109.1 hydantoinase/carbamoylase family amidase [Rhizobium sp. NRK18]
MMGILKEIDTAAVLDEDKAFAEMLLDTVATMSADVEGVSRPAFSDKETETLEYLRETALEAGLVAHYDIGRNLMVSLPEDEGAEQFALIGSHVDSVPRGGNFDGLAGVVAGLVCLTRARREGQRFARPVKVIAMRGEESAWFGPCYIGSKALLGRLSASELAAKHRKDGRSLEAHMQATGLDMGKVRDGTPLIDTASILEYLELHIEQGPVLVKQDKPVAIVTGIRGNFRYKRIRCTGESGHSGAVPRAYRHDPVLAMAELMSHIDESWKKICDEGGDLVVTSGVVSTNEATHALSRIPETVEFSLDVRSQSKTVLERFHKLMLAEIGQIEKAREVRFDLGDAMWTEPADCSPRVTAAMAGVADSAGIPYVLMPSGGGHDAAVFAQSGVPAGMIFIRNRNGSHNPQEAMEVDDLLLATDVAYRYLCQPAASQTSQTGGRKEVSMFQQLIQVIPERGHSVDGFRIVANKAFQMAAEDSANAVGYFLLAVEADRWATEHYEQAILGSEGEKEFERLSAFAAALDKAYASGDANAKLEAVSDLARQLAAG